MVFLNFVVCETFGIANGVLMEIWDVIWHPDVVEKLQGDPEVFFKVFYTG